MEKKTFLGVGWQFPLELSQGTNACHMVTNETNLAQSLWTLLSTSPGERVHRCDYGCYLRRYAFELMDTTAETLLRDEIERSIILFEPRVAVDSVTFRTNQTEGILYIEIDYTIRQTNRRSNMVYPFFLNEGTDLKL